MKGLGAAQAMAMALVARSGVVLDRDVLLLAVGDEEVDNGGIRVVWRAVKGEVATEKGRYLSGEYSLEGGQWLAGSDAPERLVVRMGRFSTRRSTDYYRDLLNWAC